MPKALHDPRPLSPHLQVYRPQMTSVLSISHRITGVVTFFGLVGLVGYLLVLAQGIAAYETVARLAATPVGMVMLYGGAFCLIFHILGGLRHLVWDMGYGFSLANVYRSGWATVLLSVALTGFLVWMTICGCAGGRL